MFEIPVVFWQISNLVASAHVLRLLFFYRFYEFRFEMGVLFEMQFRIRMCRPLMECLIGLITEVGQFAFDTGSAFLLGNVVHRQIESEYVVENIEVFEVPVRIAPRILAYRAILLFLLFRRVIFQIITIIAYHIVELLVIALRQLEYAFPQIHLVFEFWTYLVFLLLRVLLAIIVWIFVE